MEEENNKRHQKEHRIEDKEPQRVTPPLLDEDLDKLGLKNGEVLSCAELLCKSQGGLVMARGKPKHRLGYLDLSLLFLA